MRLVHDEMKDIVGYLGDRPGTFSGGHSCVSKDEFWMSDDSPEEASYDGKDDWDTDDDVEEANAADDMIKMIEGDW